MGHNIDGLGRTCRTDDYAGGVDNSIASILPLIPTFIEGFDIQEEIDRRISCAPGSEACIRLFIQISPGEDCAVVTLVDAGGNAYSSDALVEISGDGTMRGAASYVDFEFSVATTSISVRMDNVVFSASLDAQGLTNIVLGGSFRASNLSTSVNALLHAFGVESVSFESIAPILRGYYDIGEDENGVCSSISVGILASSRSDDL